MLSRGVVSSSSDSVVTIVLKKVQLLHEVSDYGYLEGELLGDDYAVNKRVLQDVVQEMNCARIVRLFDLAYARVLGFLSALTECRVVDGGTYDDVPDGCGDYVIVLRVDSGCPSDRVERIAVLCHNYLLYYALWHWLLLCHSDGAAKWQEECMLIQQDLRDFRFGSYVFRRPMYPF